MTKMALSLLYLQLKVMKNKSFKFCYLGLPFVLVRTLRSEGADFLAGLALDLLFSFSDYLFNAFLST